MSAVECDLLGCSLRGRVPAKAPGRGARGESDFEGGRGNGHCGSLDVCAATAFGQDVCQEECVSTRASL